MLAERIKTCVEIAFHKAATGGRAGRIRASCGLPKWRDQRSRLYGLHRDQDGVISILSVFAVLLLVMLLGMVMNVGRQVDGKLRMQNAADAAAYSGGVTLARGMNALAFTNHLLCDVFATTAWLREARDRNAESYAPSILDAWEQEAPVFSGSGFEKFEDLGSAISRKAPMERELVRSFGVWAAAVSDAVLPLMEGILEEELIPQYQRAAAAAFPDIAQSAAMQTALGNGRPDFGRGRMLGALWRGSGELVGGDFELSDPSLPVVDPQFFPSPYADRARRQRDRLAREYLGRWNDQTLWFFDHYAKMSQFGALWRSFTCGYLEQLLDEEYPNANLPYQIRTEGDEVIDGNAHLDRHFTFLGVVYWRQVPAFAPRVFDNPIDGDATAFAQVHVFIPRARLVWAYRGGGGGSEFRIGGVPTDIQSLSGDDEPSGGGGGTGYWEVVRQNVPTDWNLLNQRWSCRLVPATTPALAAILRTVPARPEFVEEQIVLPSLGDVGSEEIGRISTH